MLNAVLQVIERVQEKSSADVGPLIGVLATISKECCDETVSRDDWLRATSAALTDQCRWPVAK